MAMSGITGIGEDSLGAAFLMGYGMGPGMSGVDLAEPSGETGKVVLNPEESDVKQAGRRSSPAECETCKERQYQDGSNEMVSFKSAAHLSPTEAPAAVRAHENEHVSNAYKKAAEHDGKVMRASVTIHTAICPECGRTYVSGGETRTQIKYGNEKNPYEKDRKAIHADALRGSNLDLAV